MGGQENFHKEVEETYFHTLLTDYKNSICHRKVWTVQAIHQSEGNDRTNGTCQVAVPAISGTAQLAAHQNWEK